jgi:hypothetical protein
VIVSFIRQALGGLKKKHNGASVRRRRRKELPLSTRQWLVLIFGIATLVGTIFILALYYQPSR